MKLNCYCSIKYYLFQSFEFFKGKYLIYVLRDSEEEEKKKQQKTFFKDAKD